MDLVPGKTYYIKYIIPELKEFATTLGNMSHFVFECEFIKYLDKTIKEDIMQFRDLYESNDLNGTEYNELVARHPFLRHGGLSFDDARYLYTPRAPYFQFRTEENFDNVGLFKYIRLVHTNIKDQIYNKKFRETLCKNRFIDDDFGGRSIIEFARGYGADFGEYERHNEFIPNETLMWIRIDNPNIKIIKGDVETRIIQEKTLTNLENRTGFKPHGSNWNKTPTPLPRLPKEIAREVAEFVGSEEYLNKTRRGGKSKRRKNKTKRRHHRKLKSYY